MCCKQTDAECAGKQSVCAGWTGHVTKPPCMPAILGQHPRTTLSKLHDCRRRLTYCEPQALLATRLYTAPPERGSHLCQAAVQLLCNRCQLINSVQLGLAWVYTQEHSTQAQTCKLWACGHVRRMRSAQNGCATRSDQLLCAL